LTNNHIYADVSFQDNIKDSAKIIENIMKQLSLENQKKLTEDLLHLLGFKNITKDNDNQLSASYSKTLYKNLTFAYFSDI
jgi:ABC-type lipopolysaccharide export system ATPase subunit